MVDLIKLDRNTGVTGTTLRVKYSGISASADNAGQVQFAISDMLNNISKRMEDRLDVQAATEAQRRGAEDGGRDELPDLQNEATIRGRAYNAAARDSVAMRVDLQSRQEISRLENEHAQDPQKFVQGASSYMQGAAADLNAFDPALAQRFEADYVLRAVAAERRVKDRHNALIRDRQMEDALRHQLAMQDDIAAEAAALFSGDAANAKNTLSRLAGSAGRLVDTANQIGPDGTPLFSARERVMLERQAEQVIAEQIGGAWLRKQPNVLQAYADWTSGKAEIELVDDDGSSGRLNLREMLGESGYQKAGESFMQQMRSEIALRNQVQAQQDRAFKQQSDAVYSQLLIEGQDGILTLDRVEQAKAFMEPEKFVAVREIAKGGFASVSDGAVMADLMILDAAGQDMRDELFAVKSKLTQSDYVRLFNSNVSRVGQGQNNPVKTGRDFLTKGLGALSREIGLAQSANIGAADAEYDIEIDQFISKNDRQPTYAEARDIAEKVRARYSVLSVEDSFISLPLPRSMTASEKLSKDLDAQSIQDKVQKVNDLYLGKSGGDVAARNADPEYLGEMRLLKQYYDILKLKEDKNARSGPK